MAAQTKKVKSKSTPSKGSTAVKMLQGILNSKGAGLKVDGILGPKTQAAINKFNTKSTPQNKSGGSASGATASKTNTGTGSTPKKTSGSSSGGGSSKPKTPVIAPKATKTQTVLPSGAKGSKDSIGATSANKVTYKAPVFDNPFGGAGLLNNVAGGWKTVLGGLSRAVAGISGKDMQANVIGAMEFPVGPTVTKKDGTVTSDVFGNAGKVKLPTNSFSQALATAGAGPQARASTDPNYGQKTFDASFPKKTPTPKSFSGGADYSEVALSPGQYGGPQTTQQYLASADGTFTPAEGSDTNTAALDTPVPDEPAPAPDGGAGASAGATMSFNPAAGSNANAALSILDGGLKDASNDPWNKYNRDNETVKIKNNFIDTLAKNFASPQEAMNSYNSDPAFRQAVDTANQKTGVTINDIMGRITPVTNGIVGSQDTATYLSMLKKGPASMETERQNMNAEIQMAQNWSDDMKRWYFGDKDTIGILEQNKLDNQKLIDQITASELRKEKTLREQLQLMKDKNKAEYEIDIAENETNRITSKNSMVGLLARLGALDTSGAAGLAVADLDAKYQTAAQKIRSDYKLANRELDITYGSRIDTLESDRDDKILEINMDMNKDQREAAMDIMKLNFDTQKTMLEIKSKWDTALREERERSRDRASKLSDNYLNALFTTTGASLFVDLPAEFRQSWLTNNKIDPQGYKTNLVDLQADFGNWSKNQNTGLKMTDTQKFNLQKQGVDVDKYQSDPGYRDYVNTNLEE